MSEQPKVYQPPTSHQNDLKKMIRFLVIFFSSLLVLVVVLVVFADKIMIHLPFAAEKQFVKPYEAMTKRWFADKEPTEKELAIEQYIQQLGDKLSLAMALPEDIQVTYHYIDSGVVNAFATLGGHVFIFDGLLKKMPDENSFSMVLAHEIAHIKHRDPAVGLGRGLAIQMIYAFVTNDYTNTQWLDTSGELGLMYFSREQESNADVVAMNTLQSVYGHVAQYDRIFKVFKEQESLEESPSRMEQLFSSHPEINERIAKLEKLMTSNQYTINEVSPFPEHILTFIDADEEEADEGPTIDLLIEDETQVER